MLPVQLFENSNHVLTFGYIEIYGKTIFLNGFSSKVLFNKTTESMFC